MKARDELREGRHDAQAYGLAGSGAGDYWHFDAVGAIHPISWRPLLACEGHRYSSVTCPNRRSRCLSLSLPISKSVVRLNHGISMAKCLPKPLRTLWRDAAAAP